VTTAPEPHTWSGTASHIGDGFESVGGWGGDAVAYGEPGGGGSNGVAQREDEGGLCWTLLIGAGAATVMVVAMDGVMGSPNAGAFMTRECMMAGSGGRRSS